MLPDAALEQTPDGILQRIHRIHENPSLKLFAPPLFGLVGHDVSLNDIGVLVDADMALPLGVQHLGIAVLGQKTPDILALLPLGAVLQHQKLGHVAGIVPKPLHSQQIVARDGQMDSFHSLPSFSLIFSTEQPYRAMSRALTIRLNASVSTTSEMARSFNATLEPSE